MLLLVTGSSKSLLLHDDFLIGFVNIQQDMARKFRLWEPTVTLLGQGAVIFLVMVASSVSNVSILVKKQPLLCFQL